jgi:hypothetical protein
MVYNELLITDYRDIITASGCRCPLIQPKLAFLVKKIINALGYNIQNSVFEASFLQYIRILNGRKYGKIQYDADDSRVGGYKSRGLWITCMKTNLIANVSSMKTS